ncbi:MAG: peptide MFS transporter [Saprospiraceae bacterium]|nr:peptide MFS transporter [Saprospiraceae bacterium]
MLLAWVGVAIWVAFVIFSNRKIHPKVLFALFMVELWERFSYYGMRAILVLYMVAKATEEVKNRGLGFDDAKAYGIYAAYGALVYLTPIIGGYFADKMMGYRQAIIWGAILMAAGQFTLFLDNKATFFIGLALLVVGNGFFKPNISSMIGKFYGAGDPRRDGAFTIFYMGINIGAFLTPLTCGAIGEIEGWRYGFLAAGIGMVIGLLIFLWAQSKGWILTEFNEEGQPLNQARPIGLAPENAPGIAGISGRWVPYLSTILLVLASWVLVRNDDVVDILLAVIGLGVIVYMLYASGKYDLVQRQRIWVILLLLLFTTVFWTFFELAGSALNLFTDRNVNKTMLGTELTTTFFQSVNPLFIMIFAPIFSWMWIKLARADREPSAPYKFSAGLLLLGLGFLALNVGKGSATAGLVPAIFLVILYLLHTLGELTLSPVGLSLVTKLAPAQIVGFMMGIWFLSSSIAHQGGKHIAKLTAVDEAGIIASAEFQDCYPDKTVLQALDNGNGLKDDKGKALPIEKALVRSEFVSKANNLAGSERYFVGRVVTGKDTLSFLTADPAYASPDKIVTVPKDDVKKIFDNSLTGQAVSCLRQQSLGLSLGIFWWLGIVAIGCAVLLFLLGPIVTRWMHGIK